MRLILSTILMVALITFAVSGKPPICEKSLAEQTLTIDNQTYIDANQILMFVTNHGGIGRDLSDVFGYDAGTFFPYTYTWDIENGTHNKTCLYASGLWVGGYVDGEIRVSLSEYADEYVPGPMDGGTYHADSPEFKVYKIYSDVATSDWYNWPYDQGAPWKYDDDGLTKIPDLLGDQMLWSVYNDANPSAHDLDAGSTDPLGIEVRQTTWAYTVGGPLARVIFYRYRIYNKGGNDISNCYFSLWVDPDIGHASDDLVGCDTLTDLGFSYNATNSDAIYGAYPPAVGVRLLQSPAIVTGNLSDTARLWGKDLPGMKAVGMTSFVKYIGGTDPSSTEESYNFLQGLKADGSYNEYEGEPTLFPYSGDPVTGTGFLDANPSDRRFMVTTGPIDFNAGDSTEIYAALIIGLGSDRLSSVLDMRYNATVAAAVYDTISDPDIPTDVDEPGNDLPDQFLLGQNYPNPFNPTTNIDYRLTKGGNVNLAVYNIMGQKVKTLINRYLPAGSYKATWDSNDELGEPVASGVYFYRLTFSERTETRSMILVR